MPQAPPAGLPVAAPALRLVRPRPLAPEAPWLGAAAFVLSVTVGVYLDLGLGDLNADAVSRVANAFYVLFSRDPHLAAMGFVWNPLPSILELPLVGLRALWAPLASDAVAGIVVSALFAGFGVHYLCRLLARLGLGAGLRFATVALYQLNPLILLYSTNGMTDVMLASSTLAATDLLLAFLEADHLPSLIGSGFWLATAFLVRYEAVALAGALVLGLVAEQAMRGRSRLAIQGQVAVFAIPFVYAAFLWLFANWLIMKDPLYFLTSVYGNMSQTGVGSGIDAALVAARHSLSGTAAYVGQMSLLFWPVLPVAAAAAGWWALRRERNLLALLLALAAVPAFEAAFIYLGRLDAWDRFFLSFIPAGVVLVSWATATLSRRGPRLLLGALHVAVLASAGAGTVWAMQRPLTGQGNGSSLVSVVRGVRARPFSYVTPIDRYVAAHPRLLVLTDTFDANMVVLRSARPRQFVITSDRDFASVLANPRGRVGAFLVAEPTGLARLDAINRQYPGLWAGKAPWARLVRAFPGPFRFRLYRLTAVSP